MTPASTATTVGVRAATGPDAAAIAAISTQGIAERQATFDTDPVAADDVRPWLADDREPVLVAELDRRVVGWTRVIRSQERCAFAGVGECTIYLDQAARVRGVRRKLLDALVTTAERAGYWKLQGRPFTTNGASIALPAGAVSARSASTSATGAWTASGRTC